MKVLSRRAVLRGLSILPFVPTQAVLSCDDGLVADGAIEPPGRCRVCRHQVALESRQRYRQCFAAVGDGSTCDLCGHARAHHGEHGLALTMARTAPISRALQRTS